MFIQASIAVGLAEGIWSFNDQVYDFSNINSHESIVYGFVNGENTFTWTVDYGACGITSDEVTITVYDPELTAAYAGESLGICPNGLEIDWVDPPAFSFVNLGACGQLTTLALTGTAVTYLGWTLGGGALFLGAALLFMRRRS